MTRTIHNFSTGPEDALVTGGSRGLGLQLPRAGEAARVCSFRQASDLEKPRPTAGRWHRRTLDAADCARKGHRRRR